MKLAEALKESKGRVTSYDVERIIAKVLPELSQSVDCLHFNATNYDPEDLKDCLREIVGCLKLLGGVAADGLRTAYNLAPDNSGR